MTASRDPNYSALAIPLKRPSSRRRPPRLDKRRSRSFASTRSESRGHGLREEPLGIIGLAAAASAIG